MTSKSKWVLVITTIIVAGCASFATVNFESKFGIASPKNREIPTLAAGQVDYWQDVKPILDTRCAVCHGCYDAPCQLKTTAIEGLERGATKEKIYNPTRLLEAPMTRLFEDAQAVKGWREKDFFPVLNEHIQTPAANREAGLMFRMLDLKRRVPLPEQDILGEEFEFDISRSHQCPKPEQFDQFADDHPSWGMPYALPGLTTDEHTLLTQWITQGARYTPRPALEPQFTTAIQDWEAWLNGDSNKHQLAARYIYEHLFLGHLYFDELKPLKYFRLVRSSTPPGEPPNIIATRRPYDDPGVDRVYYRIIEEKESIIAKTHMPYALNQKRLAFWQTIFIDRDYEVAELPSYDPVQSANPFETYEALPVSSRYSFMLSEAKYTVMGFIKGPVCRGQVALNVINDHFWVFFVAPNPAYDDQVEAFYQENYDLLELPAARGTILRPISNWRSFAKKQKQYNAKRAAFYKKTLGHGFNYDMSIIWDGDKQNPNAALTVFRHFDSATVEKGMIGAPPKTAWLIGYTDLERIHYLLVAGYDVYGNLGHQLLSRLYMDFLRMDSELNFLLLLPKASRNQERAFWYRDADPELMEFLSLPEFEAAAEPNIDYVTDEHKLELYNKIQSHLGGALVVDRNLDSDISQAHAKALKPINTMVGEHIQLHPEIAFLLVETPQGDEYYTLSRTNAHLSITSMFEESKYRVPKEDEMMVLNGFIGSYPGAFYKVTADDLGSFVHQFTTLRNAEEFKQLRDLFGVRRTDPQFWPFSDRLHQGYQRIEPINFGLFDYNRLENR